MAYYVKIENPREFRRDILESSKKVIGCLQANRNVALLRKRKAEMLVGLKQQVEEIGMLVQKLDEVLPDKQLREEAVQEARREEERLAREAQEAAERKAREDAERRQREEDLRSAQVFTPHEASDILLHESVRPEHELSVPMPARRPAVVTVPDEERELAEALESIESKLSKLK